MSARRLFRMAAVLAVVLAVVILPGNLAFARPSAAAVVSLATTPTVHIVPGSTATSTPGEWILKAPLGMYRVSVTSAALFRNWFDGTWDLDGVVINDTQPFGLSHVVVICSWLNGSTVTKEDFTVVASHELYGGATGVFSKDATPPAATTDVVIEAFGRKAVAPAVPLTVDSFALHYPESNFRPWYAAVLHNYSSVTAYHPTLSLGETFTSSQRGLSGFVDVDWDSWPKSALPPGGTLTEYLGGGISDAFVPGDQVSTTVYASGRRRLDSTRCAGVDRYDTAVRACQSAFDTATTVVVASGQDFPDALAGASIAGAYDAPLLLTRKNVLYPGVLSEMARLGATRAIILGGTGAVYPAVESSLAAAVGQANVARFGGVDRYDTAKLIAEHVHSVAGSRELGIVVRGDTYPDALAAAPMSFAGEVPVFLAKPGAGSPFTKAAVDSVKPGRLLVVGGTGAVSNATVNSLHIPWIRLAGSNRYTTANSLIMYTWTHGYVGPWTIGVASGENFPDALAGGVALGKRGGIVLLTKPGVADPTVMNELDDQLSWAIYDGEALGGNAAVTDACWAGWVQAMEGTR